MPLYHVIVKTVGREIYEIQAESPDDAIDKWSLNAGFPDAAECESWELWDVETVRSDK